MTNSTSTYWDINGTSLQTYAMNITTLGGDRMSPPPMRGDNLIIPYAPGRVWMPKMVDQRIITLGMWVLGANPDGTIPSNRLAKEKLQDNWNALVKLIWTPRNQVTLTKRFYDGTVLKTASAQAQYASGLLPTMTGNSRAVFTIDLALADPYFYSTPVNTTLTNGTKTITVKGDDYTNAIKFHIEGPRKNIKIRNNTLGVQFEYRGDLSYDDDLDIDIKNYTSVTDPVATSEFNSVGSIRHDGDAQWFLLAPGENSITVSSDTGTGAIVMTHQEVWV